MIGLETLDQDLPLPPEDAIFRIRRGTGPRPGLALSFASTYLYSSQGLRPFTGKIKHLSFDLRTLDERGMRGVLRVRGEIVPRSGGSVIRARYTVARGYVIGTVLATVFGVAVMALYGVSPFSAYGAMGVPVTLGISLIVWTALRFEARGMSRTLIELLASSEEEVRARRSLAPGETLSPLILVPGLLAIVACVGWLSDSAANGRNARINLGAVAIGAVGLVWIVFRLLAARARRKQQRAARERALERPAARNLR